MVQVKPKRTFVYLTGNNWDNPIVVEDNELNRERLRSCCWAAAYYRYLRSCVSYNMNPELVPSGHQVAEQAIRKHDSLYQITHDSY